MNEVSYSISCFKIIDISSDKMLMFFHNIYSGSKVAQLYYLNRTVLLIGLVSQKIFRSILVSRYSVS